MVNCIDFSYNVEPALRFHDKLQLIVISFLYIAKLDFLIFAVGGVFIFIRYVIIFLLSLKSISFFSIFSKRLIELVLFLPHIFYRMC